MQTVQTQCGLVVCQPAAKIINWQCVPSLQPVLLQRAPHLPLAAPHHLASTCCLPASSIISCAFTLPASSLLRPCGAGSAAT